MKIVKSALLILGVSLAVVSVGISVYIYNHPGTENAGLLGQLTFFLLITSILIALVLNKLRSFRH